MKAKVAIAAIVISAVVIVFLLFLFSFAVDGVFHSAPPAAHNAVRLSPPVMCELGRSAFPFGPLWPRESFCVRP